MNAAAAISTHATATVGHTQRRVPASTAAAGRASFPDSDSSRNSSSASFTSAICWLRRLTSLRRHRPISRSTSGGVVEEISLAGGGSFSTMAANVEIFDSPRNARCPVIIS
jgi:hypothetical protein